MTKLFHVFFVLPLVCLTMISTSSASSLDSVSKNQKFVNSEIFSQLQNPNNTNNNQQYLPQIFGGNIVKSWDPLSHKVVFVKSIVEEKKTYGDAGVATSQARKNCTGVLIRPDIVLTAAHCFTTEAVRHEVVFSINPDQLNEADQALLPPNEGPQISSLVTNRIFLNEVDSNIVVDLVLLKIERTAPYPYLPVRIDRLTEGQPQGSLIRLVGYGRSEEVLPGSPSPVLEPRALASFAPTPNRPSVPLLRSVEMRTAPFQVDDKEIIFDQHQGKGVCSGDSGGPVFIYRNGEFIAIGINSYVFAYDNDAKPADPCKSWGAAIHLGPYLAPIEKAIAKIEGQ